MHKKRTIRQKKPISFLTKKRTIKREPVHFSATKKDPKKIKVDFYPRRYTSNFLKPREVLKSKAKSFFEKCPWCKSPISFIKSVKGIDSYECPKCGELEYECDEEMEE